MNKTATITIRVAPQLKKESEEVFEELGLTTTQAISLFLKQTALNKGLPFAVEIPNDETLKAIRDAEAGVNLYRVESVDELFKEIGE